MDESVPTVETPLGRLEANAHALLSMARRWLSFPLGKPMFRLHKLACPGGKGGNLKRRAPYDPDEDLPSFVSSPPEDAAPPALG